MDSVKYMNPPHSANVGNPFLMAALIEALSHYKPVHLRTLQGSHRQYKVHQHLRVTLHLRVARNKLSLFLMLLIF